MAIYLVIALAAGLSGVLSTAVTAAVPAFVADDLLTSAYATMQVIDQVGMVRSVYHRGPGVLGLLYAASAAGALLGSLTSGRLGAIRRQGRAVVVAVTAWGAVIVVFGFVDALWAALSLLVLAGWIDLVSPVLRSTIVQSVTTETYRSRVSALQMAVVEGGPRLGDLESGAVASAVSPQFSIVSGGLVCVIGALALAVLLPGFRRHQPDSSS